MKLKIVAYSFTEFLNNPGTIILWCFAISIAGFGHILTQNWYTSGNYTFYFWLMVAIVIIPTYLSLCYAVRRLLPRDKSALPNNRQKSIIFPRLFVALTIWMIICLEVLGLCIYVNSIMPDIFGTEKTDHVKFLIDFGAVFTAIGIPGISFYWIYLIKWKTATRRSLFSNKYRN